MGYTHYWYRPRELAAPLFVEASRDCARLADAVRAQIPLGSAREHGPRFDDEVVAFHALDGFGHEPFVVERRVERAPTAGMETPERMFSFCKTARRPYDVLVRACLIAFRHRFGRAFRVMSDGGESDWAGARRLCRRVLGYGEEFRLSLPDDQGSAL